MKQLLPALAKRSLALALALALLLSLCPVIPITVNAESITTASAKLVKNGDSISVQGSNLTVQQADGSLNITNLDPVPVGKYAAWKCKNANYLTFTLSTEFLTGWSGGGARVTFTFLDGGAAGSAKFMYHSTGKSIQTHTKEIEIDGSGNSSDATRKTVSYFLTDAILKNCGGKGVSFVLYRTNGELYLESVTVEKLALTTETLNWNMAFNSEGRIISSDSDWVYEDDQPYEWFADNKQGRVATDLYVRARVKDAAGNVVAEVANKKVAVVKNAFCTLLTSDDLNMPTNLPGTFTLECAVYTSTTSTSPQASFTKVFKRTVNGAGGVVTTDLVTPVTDLKFYDDVPMDLALWAKTSGEAEAFNVTYTLSGGHLTEAVSETKEVTLTTAGVRILSDTQFNSVITGYGDYNLNVVVKKGDIEVAKKDFTITRSNAYNMDVVSVGGNTELVYFEDAAFDLAVQLQKQYGTAEDLTLEYSVNGGAAVTLPVSVPVTPTEAVSVPLDLSACADFGAYDVVCNLKNGDAVLATKTVKVERKMATPILSGLRSDNAENTTLVYKDDAAYDLKLYLQHRIPAAANFTALYTISKDGVPVEGFVDKAIEVTDLNETEQAFALELPAADLFGDFTLALTIKDGEGNVVHTKEFAFARYLVNFVNTTLTSDNANEGLVFADDTPYDLKLSVQKADGNDELLKIGYVLVNTADPSTVIKEGSFADQVYSGTTPTVLDVAALLADVTDFGTYELKLAVTNTRGFVQEISYTFSRVELYKVTLSSAGNTGAHLVFPENVPYDLLLTLVKQTGEDAVYNIAYTVSQGETVYKFGSMTNVSISETPNVQNLDMTGVDGTGSFAIVLSLMDAENNPVRTYHFTVGRVPEMDVEFVYTGAESSSTQDTVTFFDYVPYNIVLNTKKQNGEPQDMVVKYVLTDKDGKVVLGATGAEIAGSQTLSIGSAEFVPVVMDLSQLVDVGTSNENTLTVTILDVYGNVAKEVSLNVVRKETVLSVFKSDSNPDLVYTENDGAFNISLFLRMETDLAEPLHVKYTVYAPDGTVIATVDEDVEIPDVNSNPKKYSLTEALAGYTNVDGTYKVELLVTDTPGRVREQETFNFYRIQSANSINVKMGSETNSDVIFTVQDVIDPIVQFFKIDAEQIPETFPSVLVTITDEAGNVLVLPKKDAEGNWTYKDAEGNDQNGLKTKLTFGSYKAELAKLIDFSKAITKLGTYKVNVTVTDDTKHVRWESSHEFKLVDFDTVRSKMGSETNSDLVFTVEDVVDPIIQFEKTDGINEKFDLVLTLTDKDGKEIVIGADENGNPLTAVRFEIKNRKVVLTEHITFSNITDVGTYNVNLTIIDDAGNERHKASYAFSIVVSDNVTSQMRGETNPDNIFTVQDVIDPVIRFTKTDKVKETFNAIVTVTDKDGKAFTFTRKDTNAQVDKLEITLRDLAEQGDLLLANFIDFSCITQLGTYNINVTLTDDAGNERHTASHAFTIIPFKTVTSGISSKSNPNMLFLPGFATDLVLHIQKIDENDTLAEGFTALITVTGKNDKVLLSAEGPLKDKANYKISLAELEGFDLSKIVDCGTYKLNVTLTDDAGKVRHEASHPFTIRVLENSVDTAVTSAANSDMIFTEGEDIDLTLHLRKNDGIAEAFTATITITDKNTGEELVKSEKPVPADLVIKAPVSELIDLSKLPATGVFNLNVVLTDVAGNKRLDKTTAFCRVAQASVKTQISSNTNKDMIFTDKDTVDLNLYVQKTDGIDETLHIKYTVTSPSGAVIATKEGNVKALSGSKYFKATLDNLPELTEHGTYKIHLVITDNSGIVRSESVTQLARISGTGIKHQISSSSGTNLQFSANKPFDMCLFLQKTDGVKESFQGQVYVTDPYGNVIFSIKGKINVPASGYFKFPLDLSKGTAFGTYKASYTLHDDAGTLRASGTTYFSRFSDDAVRAAVQSASGKFPGLIYGKDDAFDLALYLQKTDGLEQMLQVRYTITDMNGLVLETKQGRLTVPATGYRKIPIELPDIEALQKFGIYTFKLEVANTDGKIIFTEDYSFSRVLVPEEQLDILGVCTHLSKRGMTTKQAQQYVDLARQAGVKFWRDELPWSTVEPAKGQYKIPASADAAVDYTLSIGMEPLFILDYGNDLYGSDVTTDEWLEGYLGYVKAMVTHFKGRIMYYEVWNEWNIGLGGMDKKYREMADIYANLLIETYKVIKEIDPKVTVIGGVVAGGELKWTENMLKYPEVINAMDAFSFHCYPDNDIKEIQDQVEKLRELFKEYGREDIPMWLTETGWPTHIGRDGFTEEVSAGNLVSLYTWAIANPGVLDRIFWYDLHNDGEEAEYLEHNLGLLRNWDADVETVPMAAKKSYVAMNAMNAILLGAEYVGTYDMGHKAITAHRFNKDGKDLLVVWADDCTLNMVATIGNSNMVVTDMYGNANALTPVNGKVTLFLSDAPVYIEYDLDDTLELKEGGFKLDKAMYSATPAATFPLQITRNSGLETFEGTYAFSMPEGWSVEGVEFGAAKEGATEITDTVYVTVGDDASKGETSISVRVISNGNVMGQFSVPIEMGDICTVNPDVVFTDDGHEFKLSVQVINENSTKPLTGTINLLAPAALIGNTKASVPFEIPAGENKAVLIDVPAEMANTFHTAKVEVVLESGAKHTVTKPVSFLYAIEAPKDMKLDGVIDEQWADAMEFTAGEKNWENDNSSDIDWPGNTAKGYVMWDNEYLYVAVEAYDESHYQTATGTSIWLGDSIQMAIDVSRFTVPGYTGYNEIGFSLNSETGAIENWNWYAAPGENVSEGGIFKIVRDEDACTTTYEVALPWSEQLPAGEELDLKSVGFSLIVNENSLDEDGDPTGRTGWIEYMSGIGRRKDPTVFGDLVLAKRPTE